MIEPILERNNDDREDIKKLETTLTNYDQRLDEVEFLLNRSENKTTKYDMLHDHIVAVESSLKLFTNENSHNVGELKISLDSLSNQMEFLSSQSKSNAELIKKIQDDQFNTREQVIGLKNEFLGIANSYWQELIETIRELEAKTLEIKDWAVQAIRMSKENTTNIESIFRSISSIGDMS
jgi:ABC-type transporter Mla subunit MlaD